VRIGLAPWGATLDEWVEVARRAEQAGLDRVWTSELHRSPFVPLAATATATERVGLGTAIALAFPRSPFSAALAALDLDELSGGRLTFGVGSGVKRLVEDWHDRDFDPPVARMREWIAAFRTVVAGAHTGERLTSPGEHESLDVRGYQRPYLTVRSRIPVHLASVGPRMTVLAGEVADGWISHELTSPDLLRDHSLPRLEEGLERAGRNRDDLEVVVSACCVVDDDADRARRLAAHTVAFYASVKTYEPMFADHGFGDAAQQVQAAFRAGDRAAMVDAIPDAMVDTFTLAGTADDVRTSLKRFDGLADAIKLSPPTYLDDPVTTRAAQDRLLATFGGGAWTS
jgi:probable F420-dependent oxidoreductase